MPFIDRWKLNSQNKKAFIFVLLLIEILTIGSYFWMDSKPVGKFGFLVKTGDSYLVVWKANDTDMRSQELPSVQTALAFAREELALQVGPRPAFPDSIEHLWMRNDMDKYVLLWKTLNHSFLNQMTFRKESEARFFQAAFRLGAYSTSPLGHAVALVPISHPIH